MAEPETSRRDFLRATAGGAAGAGAIAASGSATAQAAEQPDYSGYLSGANVFDGSTVDLRGQEEVTIAVGAGSSGYAFDPPAVWVDPGTTIVWEWTGEGGAHNVVGENTDFTSGDTIDQEGYTYERTFEESGIVTYYCNPHRDLGMLGALAVGDDVPTVEVGGEAGPTVPGDAKALGVASGVAMVSTLGLAYFFMKYGGDYGEPEA
ncbi:halocyanin domain-containing protein [Halapricum hydrolyticum]|uniref:Halocyanin domain-containing protein n=1 Tax=Halapricum hydrolyticum TaxID=2979991 RepID=A0AAE3ICL9_9EURY|nr:halocyanin domain-containing protein [Halapricum hydrolyticum]MCU4718760.1 halocyanin domain-containing protein [Halapricum hydrolyticum]MCU4727747.1 halocyanin domain-containing protein [Halapricum hydrolyticum]